MAEKEPKRDTRDTRFQLFGWSLFVLCALLFIASSLVQRDPLTLAASVVFLFACGVFIVPLARSLKRNSGREE